VAIALITTSSSVASAATITSLSDDFTADTIDAAKWNITNRGLENNAPAGYNAPSTTTNADQLTLGGTTNSQYWYGSSLESVDSFSSSLETTVSVDRISLAGSGIFRSSLWIFQNGGQYIHFSQNRNESTWQYNPTNTGGGTNIGAFDSYDANTGNLEMKLVYKPLGGTNADVEIWLDGNLGTTHNFNNWNNSVDFNVFLTGQARATNNSVTAVFDNFSAVVPEPSTFALSALGLLGLLGWRRRRRR